MREDKIRALFIFEILGKPADYITKTLGELIDQLGTVKGIEIKTKNVYEPKLLEQENVKDLFTTFAETEIEVDNLNLLFDIILNRLPSHVEIIEPRELSLKNFDLSSALSSLAIKLHKYDEVAKALTIERNILINKLKEAQGEKPANKEKANKEKKEPDKKNSVKKENKKKNKQ